VAAVHAFSRRFSATVAGSVGRSSFFFLAARYRQKQRPLAPIGCCFSTFIAPFAAAGSCTRLLFKAAIRSLTGAGVEISRGLTGSPVRALLIRGGVR
jgi:hypothetical protein